MVQNFDADCTMDAINLRGLRHQERRRENAIRRCLLILSGCIRERQSRAIAEWHEALVFDRLRCKGGDILGFLLRDKLESCRKVNIKRAWLDWKRWDRDKRLRLKEEEALRAKELRDKQGDIYVFICEFLKRAQLKRFLLGFNPMKRNWFRIKDARNRQNHMERKAATMIMENNLHRVLNDHQENAFNQIQEVLDYEMRTNPRLVHVKDFCKQ